MAAGATGAILNSKKGRPIAGQPFFTCNLCDGSALTGFEPGLGLVDHIDTAFAAYNAAIAMTSLQRAERVCDFHQPSPHIAAQTCASCCSLTP